MDFDWKEREKEIRGQIDGLFGTEDLEAISALETADTGTVRDTTLRLQKILAGTESWKIGLDPDDKENLLAAYSGDASIAKVSTSLSLAFSATRQFGVLAALYGNDALKEELLEPLMKGELIAGVALSEPGGEDGSAGCKVELKGESYLLNGNKAFVTNGPIADWFAVFADLEGEEVICLVKAGQDGLTAGEEMELLGLNGLAVSDLTMHNVPVEKKYVLGPFENRKASSRYVGMVDFALSFVCVGLMKRAFNDAKAHADKHQRKGKPIMASQEIRYKLAEMLTLTQTAELMCYRAGWMMANDDFETGTLINSTKVFCAENAEKVASEALQITAGHGYKKGGVSETAFRDAKGIALIGTSSEVGRMEIADELLERF